MFRRIAPFVFLLVGACSSAADDTTPLPGPPAEEQPGEAPPAPIEEPPLPPADELEVALTGNAVGCLQIGATPAEVRDDCGAVRDTALTLEGMQQAALAVDLGASAALAEIVDGRVWRITVTEPGAATATGIEVGTPASRLATLAGARVNTGEGQYFVTSEELCGLSFGLDGVPFDSTPPTMEELRSAPASVRISEILVLGC